MVHPVLCFHKKDTCHGTPFFIHKTINRSKDAVSKPNNRERLVAPAPALELLEKQGGVPPIREYILGWECISLNISL